MTALYAASALRQLAEHLGVTGLGLREEIAFREIDAILDEAAQARLVVDLLRNQLEIEAVEEARHVGGGNACAALPHDRAARFLPRS